MQVGTRSSFTYLHSPWMQKSLYLQRHGFLFFPNPLPFFFLFPRSSLLGVARACGLEEKAALKRSRFASSTSRTSQPWPPPTGSSWSLDWVGESRLLAPAARTLQSRSRLSPVTNAESTAARQRELQHHRRQQLHGPGLGGGGEAAITLRGGGHRTLALEPSGRSSGDPCGHGRLPASGCKPAWDLRAARGRWASLYSLRLSDRQRKRTSCGRLAVFWLL